MRLGPERSKSPGFVITRKGPALINEAGDQGWMIFGDNTSPGPAQTHFPFDKRLSFESEIRFCAHTKQGEGVLLNLPGV